MTEQTNSERKIKTNIVHWKPSSCPFCGETDGGANGDRILAVAVLGTRTIDLGIHRRCFDEIFTAQEVKRQAL
jgi:hypothetical protein